MGIMLKTTMLHCRSIRSRWQRGLTLVRTEKTSGRQRIWATQPTGPGNPEKASVRKTGGR